MLGWFKKKFRKQEETPAEESIQDLQEDSRAAESAEFEEKRAEDGQPPAQPVAHEEPAEAIEELVEPEPTDNDLEPTTTEEPHIPSEPEAAHEVISAKSSEHEVIGDQPQIQEDEASTPASEPAPAPSPSPVVEETDDDPVPPPQKETQDKKKTLFSRLSERLGKTKESFTYQIDALFLGKREISTDLLDDLEEILIMADLGVSTTEEILEFARRKVKRNELSDPASLKESLKKKIKEFILKNEQDATLVMPDKGPFIIMVIGVNGVGKTTTIGKIANKFKQSGSSVLLIAADTFRAAAVSQLKIWGERNEVEVVAHEEGADPSSVVFDGIDIAKSKNVDVVLVDTAGRLHTKANLMEELKKIKRVMAKQLRGAPHEVMLVLDATTGQNAISQAKLFDAAVDVTGLTLTKLDGTSKGGIVANICREMKIPIRFIGIGEQMDDLRDFNADDFVNALFQSKHDTPNS